MMEIIETISTKDFILKLWEELNILFPHIDRNKIKLVIKEDESKDFFNTLAMYSTCITKERDIEERITISPDSIDMLMGSTTEATISIIHEIRHSMQNISKWTDEEGYLDDIHLKLLDIDADIYACSFILKKKISEDIMEYVDLDRVFKLCFLNIANFINLKSEYKESLKELADKTTIQLLSDIEKIVIYMISNNHNILSNEMMREDRIK